MIGLENLKINLAEEELDILEGKRGLTLQKVMQTVALYGEALGAERLADIEGPGHFVIPFATPGTGPSLEMLDELVAAGLKTKYPFTLDPRAPMDFENLGLNAEQERVLEGMYRDQARYDERMLQLGLRDADAYTCTPYLPEVGNTPQQGTILAWSESACAVFANSVLGARTNRNGAIIDLLCNIVGKTPLTALLTDEGRQATWLVEVRASELPHPQLLGAAIGKTVVEDVPFIVGLDRFLGSGLSEKAIDYFQDMGAGCASAGAVGLFHVENMTPEAVAQGRTLLEPGHKSYIIDDKELQDLMTSYPNLWFDKKAKPEKCVIGCPHLSLRQFQWWANVIKRALAIANRDKLAVETIMCGAPQTLHKLKADTDIYAALVSAGVKFSPTCIETIFENELSAKQAIVTNSNKLRYYTMARFVPDEELVQVIVAGEITGDV